MSCKNWPDVKIGEQLMLTYIQKAINSNKWDIRNLRTERPSIQLKDCIPTWCNIKSKEFKAFIEKN